MLRVVRQGMTIKWVALLIGLLAFDTALAQPAPTVGAQPLLQIKPRTGSANPSGLIAKLRACLTIDDMTKERLDCYDAIVPPEPRQKPPVAKIVTDCRFLKEEDERLSCFNRFLEQPLRSSPATTPVVVQPSPGFSAVVRTPAVKQTYIKRGRGGCGSRGGLGYRLPNGKCASRKR